MTAREYIDKNLQPLSSDTLVEDAIQYFIKNKLNETFIIDSTKAIFLLKLSDIIFEEESNIALDFATPFELKLSGNLHWSQLLSFYTHFNIEVLPLYDLNFELLGIISKCNLISSITDFKSLEDPGAILLLECLPNFYAASEVVRIAEMYNGRVEALFTHVNTLNQNLVITLKLNIQETRGIASTYERFGYEVSNIFMDKKFEEDVYTDRYESLLRVFDL